MKTIMITAVIAAATIATPALAQTHSNTGPRIEATVGWDRVSLSAEGDSVSNSGVTYGGELGYDYQIGTGAVLGAYAGIDGSSSKECVSAGTERACIKAGRNFTLGGRIGAPIRANSLVYVKGGYSNGRLSATYTDTAVPSDNQSGGQNLDGFHVGAGVQVGMRNGFYGKAEYVYTRYSTSDLFGDDTRFDRHRVLAGVGYRF
jgi:outer membrane immunogenic protein